MFDPLSCQQVIFRTATKSAFVSPSGEISPELYCRRDNDEFVSVHYECDADYGPRLFSKSYGVFSLHCGLIRDLTDNEIDIGVFDNEPNHAGMSAMPQFPNEDMASIAKAERIGGMLVEHHRLVLSRDECREFWGS